MTVNVGTISPIPTEEEAAAIAAAIGPELYPQYWSGTRFAPKLYNGL